MEWMQCIGQKNFNASKCSKCSNEFFNGRNSLKTFEHDMMQVRWKWGKSSPKHHQLNIHVNKWAYNLRIFQMNLHISSWKNDWKTFSDFFVEIISSKTPCWPYSMNNSFILTQNMFLKWNFSTTGKKNSNLKRCHPWHLSRLVIPLTN